MNTSHPIYLVSANGGGFDGDSPRTSHESHNVVLDICNTVPPSGQLDVSEQLTNGQGDDARVVANLWCDGQRVRGQLIVKIGRACPGVWVVIEKRTDLWRVMSAPPLKENTMDVPCREHYHSERGNKGVACY